MAKIKKSATTPAAKAKPAELKKPARKPAAAKAEASQPVAAKVEASKPAKPRATRSKVAAPVAAATPAPVAAPVAAPVPAPTAAEPAPKKRARVARAAAAPAYTPEAEPAAPARNPSIRLHKFLAHAGAGSRREAETFIQQGRVSVNGQPVSKLGFKVDPDVDRVLLDGEAVKAEERVYFLLHKPAGFICTNHDERGRPRAVDLLRGVRQRVYTVGRLDADSLGLILVTNDGDLANVVCHPRYRIQKRYQVAVKGFVTRDQIAKLEAGVWLAEGKSSPAKVVPLGRNPRRNETILEMTIFEGRNREIRRVFANIGLNVRRLMRITLGPLQIEGLQPGESRQMERKELVFVDEALRLYEANKEAWDAELPQPEKKVWRPRAKRPPGGGRGADRGPRREGGFGGPRREGGYGPPRREGDFGGRPQGGYGDRPPPRPFEGPPGGGPRRPRPHY